MGIVNASEQLKQKINTKKIMKTKILLIGWNQLSWQYMLDNQLKPFAEKYEIIFALTDVDAAHEIAKADIIHKKQIRVLIFEKNHMFGITKRNRPLLIELAERYYKEVIIIGMILEDQEIGRTFDDYNTVYLPEDNWTEVKEKLDKNFKT